MSDILAEFPVLAARVESGELTEDQAQTYMQTYATPGIAERRLSLDDLLRCVARGTYEGVLESAVHLSVDDYKVLATRVAKAKKHADTHRPKTRRRKS